MTSKFDELPRLDIVFDSPDLSDEERENATDKQVKAFAVGKRGKPFQVWYPETPNRPASSEDDYDVLYVQKGVVKNVTPTDMPENWEAEVAQ